MKSQTRVGVALLTGIAVGGCCRASPAGASKAAGLLDRRRHRARMRKGYKEYVQKFPSTLTAFGGKFMVRAGQTASVPGGGEPPKRAGSSRVRKFRESESMERLRSSKRN